MINFGKVKPGSTFEIPFGSYALSTGAPSATTGLATSDVLVYKDGGTTQRASASGFSVSADFDSLTGINLVTIDLSDNTTAGFWAAGSRYTVVVGDITIDSVTYRFPAATFTIGMSGAALDTTIASLSSQTSFTLTAGPAEDDALNGCRVYIHDVASAVQGGFATVLDYTGSTKTVTLVAGTTFTAAATDNISIFLPDGLLVAQPESYRADGATGSVVQLLYEAVGHAGESGISGTTKTVKRIDGSTTAMTFTLNDATTPTSITRAS